jgi:L-ascorbate metabolism protein UlaG (beta-lactamase superfamily)
VKTPAFGFTAVRYTLAAIRQVFAGAGYRGPVSDHFDGHRFHNLEQRSPSRFGGFLRWRLGRLLGTVGKWPRWIDAAPGPAPPRCVDGRQLRVTLVNHATVLLQLDGLNLLTDPIWSERASPVSWAGPRRRRPPGLRFEALPPIDCVLISHNHYDHLDLPTLRRLARERSPRFVTGLGNAGLLTTEGIGPVAELDWWQTLDLTTECRVTSVPAQHFSARGLRDRNKTLWCGYVLQAPAGTVYFAGDTGFGPHFHQVAQRFGPIRLALLPIGDYLPRWFMSPVHLCPAEAVQAHQVLGAGTLVAIHYGTFPLADNGQEQPVAELRAALANAGEAASRFWILGFGEGTDVPAR